MMLRLVIGLVASMSSIGSASAQEVIYRNKASKLGRFLFSWNRSTKMCDLP